MVDVNLSPHFKRSEFACHCGCGANNIDLGLVDMLEKLRVSLNRPIAISSGVRCLKYNGTLKGSVSDSAHVVGLAVDIAVGDGSERLEVFSALQKLGFKRFGVAKTFIHVDIDKTKPQNVLWTY